MGLLFSVNAQARVLAMSDRVNALISAANADVGRVLRLGHPKAPAKAKAKGKAPAPSGDAGAPPSGGA